jgi:hypothetical protein
MTKLTHRAHALCALSLSLLFLASPVAAQAPAQAVDPQVAAAAEALYSLATAEMDTKRYSSACRKLEDVTRLVPEALGVKLTLGECYEGLGKLASAWSQYTLVEALAPKAGQTARAQRAAKRAAALRPRLATMTVYVPAKARAISGLAISRDGAPIGEAQWGKPVPVDAGRYELVATAPGHRRWEKQVEVAADGVKVLVSVEPLEPAPAALGKRAPSRELDAAPPRPWQRPVGLAVMGLGVASVGVGAALGGLAISKNNESNREGRCNAADVCDEDGVDLRDAAVRLGNASTATIIVGGAALAGGAVLFFTAPRSPAAPPATGVRARAPRWTARAELLPGFVQVRGTWR